MHMLRSCVLAIATLACAGKLDKDPPIVNQEVGRTVFEKEWILFQEPRSDTLLGVGYNLGNQFNSGCYDVRQLRTSAGSDTVRIVWNRSAGDTASFKIADILGFGSEARRAVRGSILLTGVTYLSAVDVAPTRAGCRARSKDGFPINPAVVALAGAHSYAFSLYDEKNRSLNARVDKAGLRGSTVRDAADTTTVSFGSLRWVGLRLSGFELDGPVGNMVTTGPFLFLEPYNIGSNLQIRVERLQDGRFVVEHGFGSLGSAFGVDTVKSWETFLLGSAGAVPTDGFIHPAAIVPRSSSAYRLNRGIPRRLLVREFQNNSDVDSLRAWLADR